MEADREPTEERDEAFATSAGGEYNLGQPWPAVGSLIPPVLDAKIFGPVFDTRIFDTNALIGPALAGFVPKVPDLNPNLALTFAPAIDTLSRSVLQLIQTQSQLSDYFTRLFESWRFPLGNLAEAIRGSLANWRDIDVPDIDTLNTLVLEEGIPLAWVPNSETLTLLLAATDAKTRRQIIGRRWRGIMTDCDEALEHLTTHAGLERATFLRATIAAHRDGHHHAAQALATNIVDTVIKDLEHNTNHKPDLANRPILEALVLGAIWRAYRGYYRGTDPIPQTFRRHATAHGVSRRQYSRVNATFAVMFATSVAIYAEEFGY